tara:strand:+ start:120 stop:377 length:258 start_codon:yes stop_codon:yes gene_type:complete
MEPLGEVSTVAAAVGRYGMTFARDGIDSARMLDVTADLAELADGATFVFGFDIKFVKGSLRHGLAPLGFRLLTLCYRGNYFAGET